MTSAEKQELYDSILAEVMALVDGIDDPIAVMASAAAVIHHRLPYASWTGFYRVVGETQLRIGPYQGPVGCLEIPFDRGVCGAAACQRRSQVVEDVHAFPGHIACDPASRSEIVVPVDDARGDLLAVLDIDSRQPAAFDETDRAGLERIVAGLGRHLVPAPASGAGRSG